MKGKNPRISISQGKPEDPARFQDGKVYLKIPDRDSGFGFVSPRPGRTNAIAVLKPTG